MGPQLLIDKSAIQSFSSDEALFAHTYFYVVYAPTLFIEILADIKKHGDDISKAQREVAKSNAKLTAADSSYTCHYQIALNANLNGYDVPMDGRPLKLGGQRVTTDDGRHGVFFDEEPEREAHRRWENGQFTEAEERLAQRWRQSTRAIDLGILVRDRENIPKAKTIKEAKAIASQLALDPNRGLENLNFLLTAAYFNKEHREQILKRWFAMGMPLMRDYAPYANWCFEAFLTFYISVANELVGTRSTNLVDLEYVLYLPFAKYFCSGDKFHKTYVPCFLDHDQEFIDAAELKTDLKRIAKFFDEMPDSDREKYRKTCGTYPPDLEDSIVNNAWLKHMKPRDTYQHIEITPEVNEKIMERMRPMLDAIRRLKS